MYTPYINVLGGLTLYVRYRQTQQALDHFLSGAQYRTNTASLVIGMLAAFGVSMVGNFQVRGFLVTSHV